MMMQKHSGSDRRLLLVRDAGPRKGLGLFAGEIIPRGSLVCVYVGEVINGKEARRRRKLYGKQVTHYSSGKGRVGMKCSWGFKYAVLRSSQ